MCFHVLGCGAHHRLADDAPAWEAGYLEAQIPLGDGQAAFSLWYPVRADDAATAPRVVYRLLGLLRFEGDAVADAPVAPGAFPVVVFAHGAGSYAQQSFSLCERLARAGFLVVASHRDDSVVHTSPLLGRGLSPTGLTGPALMHALRAEVMARGEVADDLLFGHVDATRVGFTGHSQGAIDAIAAVDDGVALGDARRVAAAISFHGIAANDAPTLGITGDARDWLTGPPRSTTDMLPCAWVEVGGTAHGGFANICDVAAVAGPLGAQFPELGRQAAENCGDVARAPAEVFDVTAAHIAAFFHTQLETGVAGFVWPPALDARDRRLGCEMAEPRCEADADCGDGVRCVEGACGRCLADDECGAGQRCEDGTCLAVGCRTDADCQAPLGCIGGACRVPWGHVECDASEGICLLDPPACPAGEVPSVVSGCWGACVPAAACAVPGCASDADCEEGLACRDGECAAPLGALDCDPAGVTCLAAPPDCGPEAVPSVEGQCWGPCVQASSCGCADRACPDEAFCRCTAPLPPDGACAPDAVLWCERID